jgi:hypothetical protein
MTQAGKRIHYVADIDDTRLIAMATIAADVFQNLRDCLDNVATQLVIHACGGLSHLCQRSIFIPYEFT